MYDSWDYNVLWRLQTQNEDEGPTAESANPALVSIPNPCYSGYTAFAEPFEVSFY